MKKRYFFYLTAALTFTPLSFAFAMSAGEGVQSEMDPRSIHCTYAERVKEIQTTPIGSSQQVQGSDARTGKSGL